MLCTLVLWAVPLASGAEDYLVRSWEFEDGMPVRGLNCFCLGQHGFLWLGAKEGLVRFDGVAFRRPELPDPRLLLGESVTALWQDSAGSLWLGCESGELLLWNMQADTLVRMQQRWEPQPVRSIAADGFGDLWIALANHQVVRVRDGWIEPAPQDTAHDEGTVQPLRVTNEGRLYQQCGSRLRLESTDRARPTWQEGQLGQIKIRRTAPSRTGGMWIYSNDQLRLWTGNAWVGTRGRMPPGTYVTRMMETSLGDLFVGTNEHGLLIYRTDGSVQTVRDVAGVPIDRIVDLAEDTEGNILICTDSRLYRARQSRVNVISSGDNWGGRRPVAVTGASDGSLWLGTEGSGLYHIGQKGIENLAEASGLTKLYVWSLFADSDDRLWVGTWGGGLFVGQGGSFRKEPAWTAANGWIVSAVMRDRSGVLWAGTNTGLWRREGEQWTAVVSSEGKTLPQVRALLDDGAAGLWIATNGHGVALWKAGTLRYFGDSDGMPARFASSLYTSNGSVWVATLGQGLFRWRGGRWDHVGTSQGLPVDDIFHMADDGQGSLWFTSNAGVFTVGRAELEAAADTGRARVEPVLFDRDDGLPSNYCSDGNQSAAFMGPNGRYVVPTSRGVVVVPTHSIKAASFRVSAIITAASLDDRTIAMTERHELRAPAGTTRIAFNFTAPSFTNPERVRFRYRLLGAYPEWTDLGVQRSVLFSRLPPGSYTLEVAASSPDGAWNPIAATVSIAVAPHVWETRWFLVMAGTLVVAGVAFLVWYVVQRRTRLQLRELERQHAVETERHRIARDIHDELGASLTQIMMLSQPGADAPPAVMGKVHAVACQITKSMDELVWAVNPSHDSVESFAAYSTRVTQEIAGAAGLRVRLSIPDQLPNVALSAGARHHLLLFLKEALNNIVRHAGANEVKLSLAMENSQLRMEISDDGRGFVPPADAGAEQARRVVGGHGLSNLGRRANEIGARLDIESSPGAGTTVRLTVPVGAPSGQTP